MRRRLRVKKGERKVTDRCGPSGKARYRSEGAALVALDRIQKQAVAGRTPRREERAYECDLCLGWHLAPRQAA